MKPGANQVELFDNYDYEIVITTKLKLGLRKPKLRMAIVIAQ